jgi:hypothetical protein
MKEPAHLALHPFGQIPTYEEGELGLFETGAIVFHIAERHAGLLPDDANARARAITFSFSLWVLTLEWERVLMRIVNPQHTEQLPYLWALGLVADREQHSPLWIRYVEDVIHPIKHFLVRHPALLAVVKHCMGLPIAVLEIVSAVVLENESVQRVRDRALPDPDRTTRFG